MWSQLSNCTTSSKKRHLRLKRNGKDWSRIMSATSLSAPTSRESTNVIIPAGEHLDPAPPPTRAPCTSDRASASFRQPAKCRAGGHVSEEDLHAEGSCLGWTGGDGVHSFAARGWGVRVSGWRNQLGNALLPIKRRSAITNEEAFVCPFSAEWASSVRSQEWLRVWCLLYPSFHNYRCHADSM